MMSPLVYVSNVVFIFSLVTSSDGMRIVENDIATSHIGACHRCKVTNGASLNDCEICYGTSSDVGMTGIAKRHQLTPIDLDGMYWSNLDYSKRRRLQCCRLFGTSSNCCRYETTDSLVDYDSTSADGSRTQPVFENVMKRGYATSFVPLDDGPHGTGQCACCGSIRALFNYACCTYNCYK